jgi:hypothetical protein
VLYINKIEASRRNEVGEGENSGSVNFWFDDRF